MLLTPRRSLRMLVAALLVTALAVLAHMHVTLQTYHPVARIASPDGLVFTSRERRFSSLCFGTIKVPQSADVSSEEAVLSAREVARAACRAIDVAYERLTAGDALSRCKPANQPTPGAARGSRAGGARRWRRPR